MQEFERVFGRSPRVRMVEAVLRLAPHDFTRPEAAREAGLHKPSANRVLAALERDGLIAVVARQPLRYGVRGRAALLEILALTEAALRLERRGGRSSGGRDKTAAALAERFRETTLGEGARGSKGRARRPAAGERADPILELRGLGKEVWRGVDPDGYVAALRDPRKAPKSR